MRLVSFPSLWICHIIFYQVNHFLYWFSKIPVSNKVSCYHKVILYIVCSLIIFIKNKHLKIIQRVWIINSFVCLVTPNHFWKKKFQTLKLLENVYISISNTSKKWAAGKEFKALSTTVDYILSRILEVKKKVEKKKQYSHRRIWILLITNECLK